MAVSLELCWMAALGIVLATSCSRAVQIPFLHRYEPVEYDLDLLSRQHQRLTRSTGESAGLNLHFIAMGRSFDLVLSPDMSLFHKHMTFSSSSGPLDSQHITRAAYTGHDRNTPGSHVHGNMIAGVFAGTVYTRKEVYYIEPAHRYTRDTSYHSIIYRHSDINREALQGARCGVSDSSFPEHAKRATTTVETVREKRQSPRNRTRVRCDFNITGDYKFFKEVTKNVAGSKEVQERVATSLLVSYVQGASRIFQDTNFDDDDSTTDNIQFGIRDLNIETDEPTNRFSAEFIGVEAFLQYHSEDDSSEFCLSYRFTNRDFNGGVLGLAYVAKRGSAGGICEDRLNTGIVTILNYNRRVPTAMTTLTLAHEAGHNFGSEHDPDGVSTCSPGSSGGGNFIMYPFANDGSEGNNHDFSSCSRVMMDGIIMDRGQNDARDCFRAADDLCENGFLDSGEECDCGISYDRTSKICDDDPCCVGATCKLVAMPGVDCSPDQGDCCNPGTCSYHNTSVRCASTTDCAEASFCTSGSASCPVAAAKVPASDVGYILCGGGAATCDDNVCNGSFCVVLNTTKCECPAKDQFCDVCCMVGGDCVSTISIASENSTLAGMLPGRMGQHLPIGTPCNDFIGFCDALHNCFTVDNEGALDRLGNLFAPSNINAVVDWVRERWWAVLVAGVGLLVGFFLLILVVHLLLPRPEHVKQRAQRRKTLLRSHTQPGVYPDGQGHGRHEMRKRQ